MALTLALVSGEEEEKEGEHGCLFVALAQHMSRVSSRG